MLVVNLEDTGSSEILRIILKSLMGKKEYNKSEANYKVAIDFYEELLEKNDEELLENNFSKEEVLQGLKDLKTLFNKN